MQGFDIAGGSVPGVDHTKPGQPGWTNNQDAYAFRSGEQSLVAVVADGCGSAPHSEFGSRLGVNLTLTALASMLERNPDLSDEDTARRILADLSSELVSGLRAVTKFTADSYLARRAFIEGHLLFTIVGIALSERGAMVFSFGDGVYAVNGNARVIPPFPENMPPYPAYLMYRTSMDPALLTFELRAHLPLDDVESLLIGTDGVADLMEAAEHPLHGSGQPLGPLSQFWEEPRYVTNPDAIRRRLAIANCEHADGGLIRKGLLHDDTTLVVVRRQQPQPS